MVWGAPPPRDFLSFAARLRHGIRCVFSIEHIGVTTPRHEQVSGEARSDPVRRQGYSRCARPDVRLGAHKKQPLRRGGLTAASVRGAHIAPRRRARSGGHGFRAWARFVETVQAQCAHRAHTVHGYRDRRPRLVCAPDAGCALRARSAPWSARVPCAHGGEKKEDSPRMDTDGHG